MVGIVNIDYFQKYKSDFVITTKNTTINIEVKFGFKKLVISYFIGDKLSKILHVY